MLKLSYLTTDECAELAQSEASPLLGMASLGEATIDTALPMATIISPLLRAEGLLECWQQVENNGSDGWRDGRRGALRYRHAEQILFGSIALDEADFPALTGAETGLEQATAAAYGEIFALLDSLDFPALWRVWHFIPRINVIEHGSERYRQFNSARQQAFVHSGRAIAGNVPAASALGSPRGPLTIYFLAGRNAALPIENPRQLSAYDYPREYGEKSPTFARASLVSLDDQELLFISGTASIVGHNTLHEDDVVAQTRELMVNIEAVVAAANQAAQHRRFAMRELVYKVYIRRREDFSIVVAEMQKSLGILPAAVYLQADICRSNLLVEVEASGGHLVEMHASQKLLNE